MPLSDDRFDNISKYADDYIKNKIPKADSIDKQKRMTAILSKIKKIKHDNNEDSKWIDFILELGDDADKTQRNGTVHSNFTDTLYMFMHEIRSDIDPSLLAAKIKDHEKSLISFKAARSASKRTSNNKELIKINQDNIDKCICQLMHLGNTHYLLRDLTLSEMHEETLYPSNLNMPAASAFQMLYRFAGMKKQSRFLYGYDVSIPGAIGYLPIVAQHDIYKEYYLKTYYPNENHFFLSVPALTLKKIDSFKETSHETKDNYFLQLSDDFCSELINDLENYISITQDSEKIKECTEIRGRINALNKSKTPVTVNQWLDLVIYIGEQADKIQKKGTVCSRCTEVFYYILHKLRNEIRNKAPEAFRARVKTENKVLDVDKNQAADFKLRNVDSESVKQLEDKIIEQIYTLAYLGDVEPLLSLRQTIVENIMYHGINNAPVLGSMMQKFSGTSIIGYEWSRAITADGSSSIHLPKVLWDSWPEEFEKKWGMTLKALAQQKNAIKEVEESISALTKKITIYNEDTITPKYVAEIKENIKKIHFLIEAVNDKAKVELNRKLLQEIDNFNRIAVSLDKKQEVFNQNEVVNKIEKLKSEKEAAKDAMSEITELDKLILRLTEKSKFLTSLSLTELQETETSAFFVEYNCLEEIQKNLYISSIKRLIEKSDPSQVTTLNQLLSATCAKLIPLQIEAKKIDELLKITSLEPLLESPRGSEKGDDNESGPEKMISTSSNTRSVFRALNFDPSAKDTLNLESESKNDKDLSTKLVPGENIHLKNLQLEELNNGVVNEKFTTLSPRCS